MKQRILDSMDYAGLIHGEPEDPVGSVMLAKGIKPSDFYRQLASALNSQLFRNGDLAGLELSLQEDGAIPNLVLRINHQYPEKEVLIGRVNSQWVADPLKVDILPLMSDHIVLDENGGVVGITERGGKIDDSGRYFGMVGAEYVTYGAQAALLADVIELSLKHAKQEAEKAELQPA